jgi:hypothetical protein
MRADKGDALVVVRILKDGSFTCSKPCDKCIKYIKDQGIKTVYYTDWDGQVKEISL